MVGFDRQSPENVFGEHDPGGLKGDSDFRTQRFRGTVIVKPITDDSTHCQGFAIADISRSGNLHTGAGSDG